MIDEGILSKESRLIALYGINAQTSPFLKVLNRTFKTLGLDDFAIGLNIRPEDFAYMVKGMPNSKVKMALYEPEYQEEAAKLVDLTDYCIERSGLCDGGEVVDGKLAGVCFYPEAFEMMLACEGVTLREKRILLIGAGGIARTVFPLFGVMGAASVDVADESVERAADLLERFKSGSVGMRTDILRYTPGMEVDVSAYDVVINAFDLHAHAEKRIVVAMGANRTLVLIDFVRGQSAFETLCNLLQCRKLGGREWMASKALCVAKRWLGASVDCDAYNAVLEN
ncbi:hypothetical protein [Hydrogenimonas sp.]